MKKYLLATLTFLVGFIVFVLLNVALNQEVGGILSYVGIALVFAATGWVFKAVKKKEKPKPNSGFSEPGSERFEPIDKEEEKAFLKAFKDIKIDELGIDRIKIAVYKYNGGSDDPHYAIGIESEYFAGIDQEAFREKLYKQFFPHAQFDIVDLYKDVELKAVGRGFSAPSKAK